MGIQKKMVLNYKFGNKFFQSWTGIQSKTVLKTNYGTKCSILQNVIQNRTVFNSISQTTHTPKALPRDITSSNFASKLHEPEMMLLNVLISQEW